MRPLLLMLLLASATFGGVAYAFTAQHAAGRPSFSLSVSPSTQMAARGASVAFSVDVQRSGGFSGPVRLSVAGLPSGVRSQWRLTAGTVSTAPALVRDGAALTIRVSTRAALGTRRVTIRATGDGSIVRRTLSLTVTQPGQTRFSVTASPARQVVARGDVARYSVRVLRSAGPATPVSLRVMDVPDDERATFSERTLVVTTGDEQEAGTHRLVIAGMSWIGGQRVRRFAVVTLSVVDPRRLTIRGDLGTPLYPGAQAPLDLLLTNPHDFALRVRTLRVSVRAATTNAACSGASDYGVRQYAGAFPLRLRPGATTRLSAIVPDASLWPRISMHNLRRNQDVCKGAALQLDYSALATR